MQLLYKKKIVELSVAVPVITGAGVGLVVEYWPIVGIHVDIITTLYCAICVVLFLYVSFCHHPPHIYTGPILIHFLVISCATANRYLSIVLLSNCGQYQGLVFLE